MVINDIAEKMSRVGCIINPRSVPRRTNLSGTLFGVCITISVRFYLFVINHRFPTTKNEWRASVESHVFVMIDNRVLTLKLFLMRKFLLTFVLNLFTIIVTASVQYNGLNYELNCSKNTATVLKSESAENLIIPETIIIEGKEYIVTGIDNNAFQGCSQLVSVTIPKTIKNIGTRALLVVFRAL